MLSQLISSNQRKHSEAVEVAVSLAILENRSFSNISIKVDSRTNICLSKKRFLSVKEGVITPSTLITQLVAKYPIITIIRASALTLLTRENVSIRPHSTIHDTEEKYVGVYSHEYEIAVATLPVYRAETPNFTYSTYTTRNFLRQ